MTHAMIRFTLSVLLAWMLIATCPLSLSAKPPEWTQAFPTGVQQGQQSEITVTGTFEHWPPQVYAPLPGLEISPSKEVVADILLKIAQSLE